MLTDAALGILLERFVGLGRRLRLFAAVPARGFLSFFAFLTLRATFFFFEAIKTSIAASLLRRSIRLPPSVAALVSCMCECRVSLAALIRLSAKLYHQ